MSVWIKGSFGKTWDGHMNGLMGVDWADVWIARYLLEKFDGYLDFSMDGLEVMEVHGLDTN